VPFPGWEALEDERNEQTPKIWISITDSNGKVIRRINGPVNSGFHRIAWDLNYPVPNAIDLKRPATDDDDDSTPSSLLAAPGSYTAQLYRDMGGMVTPLSEPQTFEVVPLYDGALESADRMAAVSFYREYEAAYKVSTALQIEIQNALNAMEKMQLALTRSHAPMGDLDQRLSALRSSLYKLDSRFSGNKAMSQPGEKTKPTISERLSNVNRGISRSTYGPTGTNRTTLRLVNEQLQQTQNDLNQLQTELDAIMEDLIETGAPFVK
jgi:hypothetical protein